MVMPNSNIENFLARLVREVGLYFRGRRVKTAARRANLPAGLFATLLACSVVVAQERSGDGRLEQFAPAITASTADARVRFAAPNGVVRLELEVFSEAGQTLFEASTKGSVLDWTLQDAQGARLSAGSYLCVLTVKDPAGRITQRLGLVEVTAESGATLRPAEAAQMSAAQAQAVGPVAGDAALSIVTAGEAGVSTVLAHTGAEGQLTRTRGDLTFRLGDFFSGEDREQMRLTEDGRLGIGTDKPEAALDVAGEVRASGGFRFSDGTTLKAENGKLSLTNAAGEPAPMPNAAGTGTLNRLAKWSETGGAGTLTDSAVVESSGNVGIGTAFPSQALHVVGKTLIQNAGTAALFIVDRTDGKIAALGAGGVSSTFAYDNTGIFKIESNSRASIAQGVFGEATGATTRLLIDTAGNVGIGTTNPQGRLHVRGDAAIFDNPPGTIRITKTAGVLSADDLGIWNRSGGGGQPFAIAGWDTLQGIFLNTSNGNVGIGTGAGLPQAKLEVRGDIRLGSSGQYRATSSEENLRIVRGLIDPTHDFDPPRILAGSGFSVSKLSDGDYQITLNTCFGGLPAVVATNDQSLTAFMVTTQSVSACNFGIHSENDSSRIFAFIAVGPR
jgi:hypothetical protein